MFITFLLIIVFQAHAEKTAESIRATIQNQINQRHPSLPQGFWEELGVEAVPVLKKMYEDSTNANERSFYIDGLAHFSDPSTGAFLESQVNSTENEVLKKKLLSAVIQSEGEKSYDFVEPYLKDDDAHIRLSVARGLNAFEQNDKIKKRLAEFKSQEKTPWVLTDFNKSSTTDVLQKTRKQIESQPNSANVLNKASPETFKMAPALSEKNWAGIWRGRFVTEKKSSVAEGNLIIVDALSVPIKWRVEFYLPKKVKQDWKSGEFTLNYFQTNHAHWMELRNTKLDIVFLAQKKSN